MNLVLFLLVFFRLHLQMLDVGFCDCLDDRVDLNGSQFQFSDFNATLIGAQDSKLEPLKTYPIQQLAWSFKNSQ